MKTAVKLPFDVQAIRKDFPILHQLHHADVPLVYLDNAASSQKPASVIDTMSEYYRNSHANVHRGIHKLSEQATEAYENARKKVRDLIHARSHREIIFTRGTTEGINLVAATWGRKHLSQGDTVLLTVMEHHSNIVPWQMLAAEKQFRIEYIPVLPDGKLDLERARQILDRGSVKLVGVMHASNVLGTINPVQEMARMAHDAGALIMVDGAQSVPQMPVNVQELDCDFLAFSGHKMLGPTGIGIFYGKRQHLDDMPPFMGGGDMISRVTLEQSSWNELPYKFESGTPSIAEAIGLGAAVDYLNRVGLDKIHAYEKRLTAYAYERLSEISGIRIYGPGGNERGGVVAFSMTGIHAHDAAQLLDAYGIAVRAGHHCAMPLHDFLGIGATVRASFYLYNTFDEIDALAVALEQVKVKFATGT
jgi:cysteine desulfurase / selenocysteine lyase